VHEVGVGLSELGDVAEPDVFIAEGEVREADGEEVVEELHVVESELGSHGGGGEGLVGSANAVGCFSSWWNCWVLTFDRLELALCTKWFGLVAFDLSGLA